jgi:uncharacterized membrane protein
MADLIAIAYPDETTAADAKAEAERLADDLILQTDAIASIVRAKDGSFKVSTNHHEVAGGTSYGMFWGLLFGILFFVPFLGMAVGAGLGALMGKFNKSSVDEVFVKQVREAMTPGTSALFLVVEKATPDKAVAALSKFGGSVIKSSLSKETESALQSALHGSEKPEPVAV